MKVLAVDDTPIFLEAYLYALREDHEVRLAASPAEAFIILNGGFDPDIIFSDWDMPGMDGGEFCADLRQRGSTVPFIIVSGVSRNDEARGLGVTACSLKPIRKNDLVYLMDRWVKNKENA